MLFPKYINSGSQRMSQRSLARIKKKKKNISSKNFQNYYNCQTKKTVNIASHALRVCQLLTTGNEGDTGDVHFCVDLPSFSPPLCGLSASCHH